MKNYVNIHKYGTTGTVLLFIYIVSMALMPLFHIHPDKDHHDIKGSNYHSHHIPIHSNESDEADHENHHQIPEDFFLESLNLLHPLYKPFRIWRFNIFSTLISHYLAKIANP
jgi:hypothetical protein